MVLIADNCHSNWIYLHGMYGIGRGNWWGWCWRNNNWDTTSDSSLSLYARPINQKHFNALWTYFNVFLWSCQFMSIESVEKLWWLLMLHNCGGKNGMLFSWCFWLRLCHWQCSIQWISLVLCIQNQPWNHNICTEFSSSSHFFSLLSIYA